MTSKSFTLHVHAWHSHASTICVSMHGILCAALYMYTVYACMVLLISTPVHL